MNEGIQRLVKSHTLVSRGPGIRTPTMTPHYVLLGATKTFMQVARKIQAGLRLDPKWSAPKWSI